MSEEEQNQPRNAQAGQAQQQHVREEHVAAHTKFSELGLTKRNEDFMFQLDKQLDEQGATADKKETALQETIAALLEGQKTGVTAKQLFGTPTEKATEIIKGPVKRGPQVQSSFTLLAADNGLMFFNIFTFMFGLMSIFSPKSLSATGSSGAGTAGIVAIVVVAVTGGLLFAWVTKTLSPAKKADAKPLWYRIVAVVVALVAWVAIYFVASMIPSIINPQLPGLAYVVLAVLGFVGDMYLRRRFNIVGGAFGGGSQQRRK